LIAVDTNLLVYAHRAATPEHPAAVQALRAANRNVQGWGYSLFSVGEFWRVVTNPTIRGGPSTPEQTSGFLDLLAESGAQCWLPLAGFPQRLLLHACQLPVVGPQIFDLQIGLICREAGATELWTHDHNFVALPGLKVFDPLA